MEKIKKAILDQIDQAQRYSPEEYGEFLEWLASEVECREMALGDDDE